MAPQFFQSDPDLWGMLRHLRTVNRPAPVESAFELYDRIEPVALVYRAGRRTVVEEFNSAKRLLRSLHRIGRYRRELRGMISDQGALTRESLAALNVYLCHCYGRQSLNRARCAFHRFTWAGMRRKLGLCWVR